ncbi:camp-dependent protein kinase catalytic subunit [Chytridiales sp. JEL 0842]|nr:camp-dependent protein kinase catalytic subunit [Chytridiales sp. JEL 0842]
MHDRDGPLLTDVSKVTAAHHHDHPQTKTNTPSHTDLLSPTSRRRSKDPHHTETDSPLSNSSSNSHDGIPATTSHSAFHASRNSSSTPNQQNKHHQQQLGSTVSSGSHFSSSDSTTGRKASTTSISKLKPSKSFFKKRHAVGEPHVPKTTTTTTTTSNTTTMSTSAAGLPASASSKELNRLSGSFLPLAPQGAMRLVSVTASDISSRSAIPSTNNSTSNLPLDPLMQSIQQQPQSITPQMPLAHIRKASQSSIKSAVGPETLQKELEMLKIASTKSNNNSGEFVHAGESTPFAKKPVDPLLRASTSSRISRSRPQTQILDDAPSYSNNLAGSSSGKSSTFSFAQMGATQHRKEAQMKVEEEGEDLLSVSESMGKSLLKKLTGKKKSIKKAGKGKEESEEAVEGKEETDGAGAMSGGGGVAAALTALARSASKRIPSMMRKRASAVAAMEEKHVYNLNDFQFLKQIGKGAFASVHIVRLNPNSPHPAPTTTSASPSSPTFPVTPKFYALKTLQKREIIATKQTKHVLNEKNLLTSHLTTSPFLVHLHATFQDPQHLFLLLEYLPGGDMFTHIRKYKRFPEGIARFYASEILAGVEYIHSKGCIYRDLKPENILLDAQGHIKLVDFGFARELPSDGKVNTFCGTPAYMAPEIIQKMQYTTAADWWSFGIVTYELMAGYSPFQAESPVKIYEKVLKGEMRWSSQITPLGKTLLSALLESEPSKRLGAKGGATALKVHPWFKGVDWKAIGMQSVPPPHAPRLQGEDDFSNFDKFDEVDWVKVMERENEQGGEDGYGDSGCTHPPAVAAGKHGVAADDDDAVAGMADIAELCGGDTGGVDYVYCTQLVRPDLAAERVVLSVQSSESGRDCLYQEK